MLQIPSVSLFRGSEDQLFRRFTTGLKIWWLLKLFSVETPGSLGVSVCWCQTSKITQISSTNNGAFATAAEVIMTD